MKVLEIQSISDFGFLWNYEKLSFIQLVTARYHFKFFNGQGPADLDDGAKKTLKIIRA